MEQRVVPKSCVYNVPRRSLICKSDGSKRSNSRPCDGWANITDDARDDGCRRG